MAIILLDSFDHYTTTAEAQLKGWNLGAWQPVTGRFSGYGAQFGNGGGGWSDVSVSLPTLQSSLVVGFALKWISNPVNYQFFQMKSATTWQIQLLGNGSGQIKLNTESGTTTGTASIVAGAWNYIEVKVTTFSTTLGAVTVRVNGVNDIAVTGVNTNRAATGTVSKVCFDGDYYGNTIFVVDDLYVCNTSGTANNDFMGDIRIEYLVPTAAGVRTQFAASSGSNWQAVDEIGASDTDYNSSNVPGAMDLFTMSDLAGNGLIRGVQTISRAKKDDAGYRKAVPVFRKASGLGETARWYPGSKVPVGDAFSLLRMQVFETSPDTGAAWTVDEVNALQYGYAVGDAGMFTIDARLV